MATCVRFALVDSQFQVLTSHAIFNHRAYANEWIESSLVNLHPSPRVMLHLEACFPRPEH
jgi:hypothetical protein